MLEVADPRSIKYNDHITTYQPRHLWANIVKVVQNVSNITLKKEMSLVAKLALVGTLRGQ